MIDRPAITTIFFDIGGVLLEVNEQGGMDEIVRLTSRAPEWLGSRMAGENLYALERGEITLRDYYAAAFKDAGTDPPITYNRFEQFWTELLLEPTPVADLLPALRRQARVWFLTNTNQVHMDYLKENYPFMALADGVISSHEVGYRKPDKEIFRLALRRAGISAEQALFIDDKLENVASARELGIRAHQYTSLPGLVGFLSRCGLDMLV